MLKIPPPHTCLACKDAPEQASSQVLAAKAIPATGCFPVQQQGLVLPSLSRPVTWLHASIRMAAVQGLLKVDD